MPQFPHLQSRLLGGFAWQCCQRGLRAVSCLRPAGSGTSRASHTATHGGKSSHVRSMTCLRSSPVSHRVPAEITAMATTSLPAAPQAGCRSPSHGSTISPHRGPDPAGSIPGEATPCTSSAHPTLGSVLTRDALQRGGKQKCAPGPCSFPSTPRHFWSFRTGVPHAGQLSLAPAVAWREQTVPVPRDVPAQEEGLCRGTIPVLLPPARPTAAPSHGDGSGNSCSQGQGLRQGF